MRAALWRCLMFCLPALIIGAALRLTIMMALPEAYYGSDSNSYFQATSKLWTEGDLELKSKRRWIYPLLLMVTPALPGRTLTVVALAQHALGLATVFGIGWVTMHLTRFPRLWVPLVTTLAVLWPRMLWHEHEVIAESLLLAAVVSAVALAFPAGSLLRPRRLFWFVLATTMIVAVKPHGRPLWLGLLLAAVLIAGVPWRWDRRSMLAIVASVVVMLSSGSSEQGSWLLLSSALPVVRTEGEKWREYRAMLRPYIEETRALGDQFPWEQAEYKKMLAASKSDQRLGPEWARLCADRKKFSRVARDLAIDGILHSPLTYTRLVLLKIGRTLSDDNAGERLVPKPFWENQESNNTKRWADRPKEMVLLYEMDEAGYRALVAERQERHAWYEPYLLKFTRTFTWTRTVKAATKTLHPAWFGLLALFGLLTCLRPTRWRLTSPLWLSLALYLGIIFSIGDGVSRYLLPVEWMGMVFVALGLDWLLGLVWPEKSPAPVAETVHAPAQV